MVICLEQGADLHMAQLMPLPLTVSCSSKIQTGFTFLVPADLGTPRKRAVKRVCVCVCVTGSYNNSHFGRIWIERVFSLKFEKNSTNKQQNLPDVINVPPTQTHPHRHTHKYTLD